MLNNYYKITAIGPQAITVPGYQSMPPPREHSAGHRRGQVSTCWVFPFDDTNKDSDQKALNDVRALVLLLREMPAERFSRHPGYETYEKNVRLTPWKGRWGWPSVGET